MSHILKAEYVRNTDFLKKYHLMVIIHVTYIEG